MNYHQREQFLRGLDSLILARQGDEDEWEDQAEIERESEQMRESMEWMYACDDKTELDEINEALPGFTLAQLLENWR